jgi:hypothetical protein
MLYRENLQKLSAYTIYPCEHGQNPHAVENYLSADGLVSTGSVVMY